MAQSPRTGRGVAVGIILWLGVAAIAGRRGMLDGAPPAATAATVWGLVAIGVAALVAAPALRTWADTVDLRWLLAPHVLRLPIGAAFLALGARGVLPGAFTRPAGWGDMVVGLGACLLMLRAGSIVAGRQPGLSRRVLLAWNVLGLADILLVVATALRLGLATPGSMAALGRMPLSLLPSFLVPLILLSHGIIFWRHRRAVAMPAAAPGVV